MEIASVTAIVVAAGKGKRMGSTGSKLLLPLGDKPVVVHTLTALQKSRWIKGIILVVGQGEETHYQREIIEKYHLHKIQALVVGGQERADSVCAGLNQVPKEEAMVLIHDGARPFVSQEMIQRTLEAAAQIGGAVAGVPVKDTIKRVDGEQKVLDTPPRDRLWAIQTPQVFQLDWLKQAYATQELKGATDDAMLLEKMGLPVQIVMGSYQNIKITTPEDLVVAEALLQRGEKKS